MGDKAVEVLPPAPNSGTAQVYAEIAAQINQYTDRPDLFLETIEKHDPGFIKKMNDSARLYSKRSREQRFRFGKIQSYTALSLSLIAALIICAALVLMIYLGYANFWTIVGLAIFYAVTQGGSRGFGSIISAISTAVSEFRKGIKVTGEK